MYTYEVTKYNPVYRKYSAKSRTYIKDDWIGISDIGKVYEGELLTAEMYKKVEDAYIAAVQIIVNFFNIPKLHVDTLYKSYTLKDLKKFSESYSELYEEELLEFFMTATRKKVIHLHDLPTLIRLALREDLGVYKIYYKNKIEISIRYDFLMSIKAFVPIDEVISAIEKSGIMFVQQFRVGSFRSMPYIKEFDEEAWVKQYSIDERSIRNCEGFIVNYYEEYPEEIYEQVAAIGDSSDFDLSRFSFAWKEMNLQRTTAYIENFDYVTVYVDAYYDKKLFGIYRCLYRVDDGEEFDDFLSFY